MVYKSIISGHIWLDDNGKEQIEILTQIDNDDVEAFCGVEGSLLDEIDIGGSKDYFFIAIVKSRFVEYVTWEGNEWDTEHEVIEIKDVYDVNHLNS